MISAEWLATPWGAIAVAVLMHFAWQAVAICLAIGWFQWIVGSNRSEMRYAASVVGLMLLLVVPLATTVYYVANPGLLPMQNTQAQDLVYPIGATATSPVLNQIADPTIESKSVFDSIFLWLHARRALWIGTWGLGAGLMSARLLFSWWMCWRVRANSQTLPDKIQRLSNRLRKKLQVPARTIVMCSNHIRQAVAFGVIRPIVLVPASWVSQMPLSALEAIIAHELAHVRRWDVFVNMIQRVTETVFFFHPAVWWLSSRIHQEREICCDRMAIRATGKKITYAQTLSKVAEAMKDQPTTTFQFGTPFFGGKRMSLLRRVSMVLDSNSSKPSAPGKSGLAICLAVAAATLFFWSQNITTEVSAMNPEAAAKQDEKRKGKKQDDDSRYADRAEVLYDVIISADPDSAQDDYRGVLKAIIELDDDHLHVHDRLLHLHDDTHRARVKDRLSGDALALVELDEPLHNEKVHGALVELAWSDQPGDEQMEQIAIARLLQRHAQDGDVDRQELARQLREIADKLAGNHKKSEHVELWLHEHHERGHQEHDGFHDRNSNERLDREHLWIEKVHDEWRESETRPRGVWLERLDFEHHADPHRSHKESKKDDDIEDVIDDLRNEVNQLRREIERLRDGDQAKSSGQRWHFRDYDGDGDPDAVLEWMEAVPERGASADEGGIWVEFGSVAEWVEDPKSKKERKANPSDGKWHIEFMPNRKKDDGDDRQPDSMPEPREVKLDLWRNVIFGAQPKTEKVSDR